MQLDNTFPRPSCSRSLGMPDSDRYHRAFTTAKARTSPRSVTYFRYHILVILVSLIFLCSAKMPYMRASEVGGQPGT